MTCQDPDPQPIAGSLVERNKEYAARFHDSQLAVEPAAKLAVVACMDARIDAFAVLGLDNGDAHIIRNAGGVITDDVIRSLCLSQRFLGTREIVLVHHTDCGLQQVNEADFRSELNEEIGIKPWWSLETFDDPYDDVRQSIQRLHMTPFIKHKLHIRGFVYDVTDGLLHEVTLDFPNADTASEQLSDDTDL
jgi:carbonic anhydrase